MQRSTPQSVRRKFERDHRRLNAGDYRVLRDRTRIYENRDVLVLRTRWGTIIEQRDSYADPQRIAVLDRALDELGIKSR